MKNSKKQRIFKDLCRRIREEEWAYQEKLPPMEVLAEEYQVSRITVVGAMELLKNAGFVTQSRGRGTFVCWQKESVFFPFLNRQQPKEVEVTFAMLKANPQKRFVMQLLADCFMKIYTDVNIRLIELSYSSDTDPYLQRISSRDLPCCGEFFWHSLYARINALQPLEELPRFNELQKDLLPQAIGPTSDADGVSHIHAININFDLPSYFCVNCEWAEQLPVYIPSSGITWSVISRMFRHAAGKNLKQHTLGLCKPQGWSRVKFILELMGQDVLDHELKNTSASCIHKILHSGSALMALEHLQEWLSYPEQLFISGKDYEHFALNQIGLLPFGSSWLQFLQKTINGTENVRYFDMPALRKGRVYQHFYSSFSLGIFRGGISSQKQLHAAWDWMRFLFGSFPQELTSQEMTLAVHKDVTPHVAKVNPALYEISRQALRHSWPQPDFVGLRMMYSDLALPLQKFFDRQYSGQECLKEMQNIFSKRQELATKNEKYLYPTRG